MAKTPEKQMIALSGGPLEEPVDGADWPHGLVKVFPLGDWNYSYRRLPPDEEDIDPLMAVYTGRERAGRT